MRLSAAPSYATELLVYDHTGRCVLRQTLSVVRDASNFALDLRSLAPGVYFLRLGGTDAGRSIKAVLTR